METLLRQVRRARRRLVLKSLGVKLAWCWSSALTAAALAIGIGKSWPIADEAIWTPAVFGVALTGGLIAAVVGTWIARPSTFDAAVEIDRRFGLRERVSSALALDRERLETPIGRALVLDAQARIDAVDLADRFGLFIDGRAALPLGPAAVALALSALVGIRVPQTAAEASPADAIQVKRPAENLAKKLEERRREAAEKGLKEADLMLARLEESARNLAEKQAADRKQSLVALNDLVKQAEKRRSELVGPDELKQQLAPLKSLDAGPAQKLGRALKSGDLESAIKEIEKLANDLAADKLDPQTREELARQLDALREAIDNRIAAHNQAEEKLKEQVEAERRAGNLEAAEKLEQQSEKLAAQRPQIGMLRQMAGGLRKAADAAKRGDSRQTAQSLAKVSQQLQNMQQGMQELETLDAALAQVADCKNAMACKECDGQGCAACQDKENQGVDQRAQRSRLRGVGRGAGKPEDKVDAHFYDTQVKQKVGKGAATVIGEADGPNRKGQVQEQIELELSNTEQQTADVLSGQRLPRDYREHARKYFDTLREGKR